MPPHRRPLLLAGVIATGMLGASCADPVRTTALAKGGVCKVEQRAQVPVLFADGRVAIPIGVNGTQSLFMLDTGADAALLARATADQAGLKLDSDRTVKLKALGGEVDFDQATVPSLTLGDIALAKRAVGVGDLPISQIGGQPIGGILGSDFLNQFDFDLDVPGRQLTVYDVRHCTGRFIPWQQPFAQVPATWQLSFSQLTVPVRLNGRPASAFIDTGTPYSMISRRAAELRLGVPSAAIEADRVVGFGVGMDRHRLGLRLHKFASFSIGTLQEHDIELPVLETKELDQDMLIGMDFVAVHRIWFSPSTTQLFIALGQSPEK